MSIKNLNLDDLKTALTGAWQKELNTTEDPANGQWYTNGANNDNIGLYGGLTDTLPTGLVFDQTQLTYVPTTLVCMAVQVDNRNGLNPNSTVTLSKTYTSSTTTTNTVTNTLTVGIGVKLSAEADLKIIKAGAEVSVNVQYEFSYATSTATEESEEHMFSHEVPVTVPTGKIYKVVLTATAERIQVPYTAYVTVSGETETWFEDRINGHYNWSTNAAAAFSWINQFATAGADSANYGVYPQDPSQGAVTIKGMLNHQTVANFQSEVYDITPATTTPQAHFAVSSARVVQPGEPASEGVLISKTPLTQSKATGA